MRLPRKLLKMTDKDILEVTIFALQPHVDADSLESPAVKSAFKEVVSYKDLLLLGDLPTITQKKRQGR